MKQLSDIEKQVIYLKLLSKVNTNITDEVISNMVKVPIEDIRDYKIMTN